MTNTSPQKTRRKPAKKEKPVEPEFRCGFCDKVFMTERSLMAHMCEKRRRYSDKDHKHVRFGFMAYSRFYEINYHGKKQKSFADFVDSRFYSGFVAFGRYIDEINAINPSAFLEFLLKLGLPLDKWTSAAAYESYIRELNKKESPDAAIERNILLMQQWANDTGEHWTDFFRKIKTPLATLWIKSGRISPWVMYLSKSSPSLFNRMSPEQMQIITPTIDPTFWKERIKNEQKEVKELQKILDDAGL